VNLNGHPFLEHVMNLRIVGYGPCPTQGLWRLSVVLLLAAAGSTALPGIARGQLVHRYGFEESGGAGTTLFDTIGGKHGSIVAVGSNNATVASGQVTLTGGSKANSDYVALPAGLLTGMTGFSGSATIELWATQLSAQNWSRLFEFGNATNNQLLMSWTQGTAVGTDQNGIVAGGVATIIDNVMNYSIGQEYHVAMTIAAGAGPAGQTQIALYKDGSLRASVNTSASLSALQDDNNWLGRTHWNDPVANASYNEFRVYNRALSASEVAANTILGPNVLASEFVPSLYWTGSGWNSAEGSANGGSGVWDSGVGSWYSSNRGVLRGTAGTITVGQIDIGGGLRAETDGYVLSGGAIALGTGGIDVPASGDSLRISSVLQGVAGLTKDGAGRLILDGVNGYSGVTTVSAGTLVAGHSSALGTSAVEIASGAVLLVADGVSLTNPLSILSGGRVKTGHGASVALPSAAALTGWASERNGSVAAEILAASGSALPTLSSSWAAGAGEMFRSEILSLSGTGAGNTFVLQMGYDATGLSLVEEEALTLGWFDPSSSAWVLAVDGNQSGSIGTEALLRAWQAGDALGTYGVDTVNKVAWAVLDHNSQFAVIAVPEPGGMVLLGAALAAAAAAWRANRRPGVA